VRGKWTPLGPLIAACVSLVASTIYFSVPAVAVEANTKKGAVVAFERYVDALNKRQWGRIYKRLYPGQQSQISSSAFLACMDVSGRAGITIEIDEILETYAEKVTIPGTADTVKTVALTVKTTARSGSASQQATDTVHQVYADGRWRIALTQSDFDQCLAKT
jgi:hypothetical protein